MDYGLTAVKYPDLLAKATDVYHDTLDGRSMTNSRNAIYDALEAERERCAAIIDNGQETTTNNRDGTFHTVSPRSHGNRAGLAYADAIRTGTAPE